MPTNKKIISLLLLPVLFFAACSSCNVYKFRDVSIPTDVKTVKINYIENRARLVNPQLSPQLTDRLKQKIVNQTRLTPTNSDSAHFEITAYIKDYTVTTSGISNQQVSTNRLNVTVHVKRYNRLKDEEKEFDVSHSFDFSGNISLTQAEASLTPNIIKQMTDDIFNQIFSEW
jgi:hypothetical protein